MVDSAGVDEGCEAAVVAQDQLVRCVAQAVELDGQNLFELLDWLWGCTGRAAAD